MSSPDNPRLEPQPPANADPQKPPPADPDRVSDPIAPASFTPPASQLLAVENPAWNGWDVLLIVALALVTIFVSQLAILLGAHRFLYPHATLADLALKPILLLISQFVVYIAVAACMIMLVDGKYRLPFWSAIRWNWPRSGWRFLALGTVTLIGLGALQSVLPMPKDTPFDHLFDRPRDAFLLSAIAVSVGPLMEELFFRGFLYPVIARRMGVTWGILLTALPFGLLHLQQYGWAWAAGFVIFLVGVVCGAVRAATKSVGASFLVHVGYNGTQMLIAIVATHGFRHVENAMMGWR